jgi:Conjugal transfer protein
LLQTADSITERLSCPDQPKLPDSGRITGNRKFTWTQTASRASDGAEFDYVYRANEAPFDIQTIYHDDKFTYIKTNAPEKFSVYEMKDGKPNLISYDLREGTYVIPKVMNSGYVELGKKRMEFSRKG